MYRIRSGFWVYLTSNGEKASQRTELWHGKREMPLREIAPEVAIAGAWPGSRSCPHLVVSISRSCLCLVDEAILFSQDWEATCNLLRAVFVHCCSVLSQARTGTMQWEAPGSRPHFPRWWSEPSQGIAGEVSCSHAPNIIRDNEEKCLRKGNSVRDVLALLSPIDVRPIPCSQNQSTPFVRCTWTRQTSSCIDTGQDAGPRPPA